MHSSSRRYVSCSKLFLSKFVLRMRSNCYFWERELLIKILTVGIAVRFGGPNFLKSNNYAIRRRFHAVTLTLNVCSRHTSGVTCSNSVTNISDIEQYTAELLMIW